MVVIVIVIRLIIHVLITHNLATNPAYCTVHSIMVKGFVVENALIWLRKYNQIYEYNKR